MRDEEVLVLVTVAAASIAIVGMVLAHVQRRETLRTIQRALESSAVDDLTRRTLIDTLNTEVRRRQEMWGTLARNAGRIVRTLVFIGGWLTFVIGGLVLIAMCTFGHANRWEIQSAAVATAIGFGLVTLPLALRELEARRAAAR